MKLPTFKRLKSQDYPEEQQSLIEQISFSLNNGIEALFEALNKKLTIKDNLYATERDVELRINSAGYPLAQTFATVDFGGPVRNVFVGKVENLTNPQVFPTSGVHVSWNNTASGIQITNVVGLPPNNTFRLRIVMFG